MDEFVKRIEQVFEQDHLRNLKISLGGTSEKTDGYLGNITFITINGETEENKEKKLHAVVKTASTSAETRRLLNIHNLFKQEILLYSKILPALKSFEKEKGIKDAFEAYANCYGGDYMSGNEIIILENLKQIGYRLHDRKQPLNLNHLKLTLSTFGRFHAISFAMKDQRKQQFDNLIEDLTDCQMTQMETVTLTNINLHQSILKLFKDRNENILYQHFSKLFEGISVKLIELMEEDTGYHVITHSDSWINNFMFLYKDQDSTSPIKLAILDWQMSSVRNSPLYDIIQFLYTTCPLEHLTNWRYLLTIYYESFSQRLRELGSDPEKLYPYGILENHWKKFSLYGMVLVPITMKMMYIDDDQAISTDDVKSEEELRVVMDQVIIKDENYYEKIIGLYKFYFDLNKDID